MATSHNYCQEQQDKPQVSPHIKSFIFYGHNARQPQLLCRQLLGKLEQWEISKPQHPSSEGPRLSCHLDWWHQREPPTHLSAWLKYKIPMLPSAGEDVEKLDLSCIAGGDVNGIATVENSVTMLYKTKHMLTIQSHSWVFTQEKWKFRFIPKPVHKYSSSFICNSIKLKTSQMSFSGWIDNKLVHIPWNTFKQ